MGTTYSVVIFFGIREPEKWIQEQRTKKVSLPVRGCPKGHQKMVDQSHFDFCSVCGTKVQVVLREEKRIIPAFDAYPKAGEVGPLVSDLTSGNGVFLGEIIFSSSVYDFGYEEVLESVTPVVDRRVRKYLHDLGTNEEPRLMVIVTIG